MRPILGCGWSDETRGQATCPYVNGTPELKTCPEWYAQQEAISSVWGLLPSYRKNLIGPIWDLPEPLIEYLEVLDGEMETFINMDKK